ncbi:MAG: family 20 glycosylhydrolase, partial [Planctomycetota bacterium]
MDKCGLYFHLDQKRAMWRASYQEEVLSTLRSWGYNGVVMEIEDKLCFEQYPSFAHTDALSEKALASQCAGLRDGGFEVIPMVQALAHAEYILTHEEFAPLRESHTHSEQFAPGDETARAFILDLCDTVIDTTKPTQFFHLGGDESWALGKSLRSAQAVREKGIGRVYLEHMLPIFDHIIGRGLRPIIWADIVLTHPEVIDAIPRSVVMMDWDYWTGAERWPQIQVWGEGALDWEAYQEKAPAEFREHLERFAVDDQTREDGTFRSFYAFDALREMGFEVMLAPATRSHGDSLA